MKSHTTSLVFRPKKNNENESGVLESPFKARTKSVSIIKTLDVNKNVSLIQINIK